MEIIKRYGWVHYVSEFYKFDADKSGKWMYFFKDKEFASKVCEDAVKRNIVGESKHTDDKEGVACFYLNCDDIETHKKIISFFIENNLIARTKSGRLSNISFKLNNQTSAGEYGDKFHSEITLSKFIDLYSGKWLL